MTQTEDHQLDNDEQRDQSKVESSILPTDSPQTDLGPTTDYDSRKVMLRAERRDKIKLVGLEERYIDGQVPKSFNVVERTDTYFGPELFLEADGRNYLLTAPGPDTQLLLWSEIVNERDYRESWSRLAEVRAKIDDMPQYDVCDQCGYPIRSKEHERLSAIGRCPDGPKST